MSMKVTESIEESLQSWVVHAKRAGAKGVARIWVSGEGKTSKGRLPADLPKWMAQEAIKSKKPVQALSGKSGPIWWVRPHLWGKEEAKGGHLGLLTADPFVQGRDALGQAVGQVLESGLKGVTVDFFGCDEKSIWGALVGADLAAYQFRRLLKGDSPAKKIGLTIKVDGKALGSEQRRVSSLLASAVNMARQLVNLPGNALNPESFSLAVSALFRKSKGSKVEIWNATRLKKEKLNLLLAVGQASVTPARLVKIRYRPSAKVKNRPLAFVGKGITFDTGGLDLKPSSGMRLMKKDMGGAAAVAALAWWVDQIEFPYPCDFYLALAENAVSGNAFRPGDILTSRNGLTVEIHNTDAEGRLALADALDVAVEEKPSAIVDVATLTGAIKAGLGSQIAGLFGNDDKLIDLMAQAGQEMGDWLWPMPLYRKYKSALKSNIADMVNAGDGFGGAITAALFLENFVKDVPWLHLDVYAWKDAAEGAITESGGSGQPVQALVAWLNLWLNKKEAPK